ncbi:hypothetical protein [Streptomyces cylindrosporus]|uniref:Uncharacterized protein n=1 Tax=Streptomyces cylindrosporus TaxID=2927583 RepID=A0ABS9YPG5_9ACTN|nr:hypothetical protein [Streptomyces cylindrosporus]MCI3279162.1 hypothetical protein [Streptomyces cylindrosporus]
MTVYALKHPDGRWLYHLPKPDADDFRHESVAGAFADGQPMEKLHSDWWAAAGEAAELKVATKPRQKTTDYRLTDADTESVKYPATLTVAEWNERREYDDNMWQLYKAVREDLPPVEYVYDEPVMVLEGRQPPGPDEPQWVARLPHALTERPEYKHLFPGHIPGFAEHLMDVFKAMPRVQHVFHNYQGRVGVYVALNIPFDPPQTVWQANIGRGGKKLKSGRNVPQTVYRTVNLPIPDNVAAVTYEQALTVWEEQAAFWTSVVESTQVAACGACGGTGHVTHGSEEYAR